MGTGDLSEDSSHTLSTFDIMGYWCVRSFRPSCFGVATSKICVCFVSFYVRCIVSIARGKKGCGLGDVFEAGQIHRGT